MLSLNKQIQNLSKLGKLLQAFVNPSLKVESLPSDEQEFIVELRALVDQAKHYNGWFTSTQVTYSLGQWGSVLNQQSLESWLLPYNLISERTPKKVGLILAGNIPLVGLHDVLSVLLSGNIACIKLSSSDHKLIPFLLSYLLAQDKGYGDSIKYVEQLKEVDAVIATGSDNSARYFEYYFRNLPKIIRKNRNSVAVLTGQESSIQLQALGKDIFTYYGLGCRSVSKVFVPRGYDFDVFFKGIYDYHYLINDNIKYAHNYDYNKAVYLMSNYKLLENGFLILKEDKNWSSPIGVLFYECYDDLSVLNHFLEDQKERLQCVVSLSDLVSNTIALGETQSPSLTDYADSIDTIEFLKEL